MQRRPRTDRLISKQVSTLRAPARTGAAQLCVVAALSACAIPAKEKGSATSYTAQPTYTAGVEMVREPAPAVRLTVRAMNISRLSLDFQVVSPCTLILKVYRGSEASGPAVWDLQRWWQQRPGGCKGMPKSIVLGPGESRLFVMGVLVGQILGDSISEGRYHFFVEVAQRKPVHGLVSLYAGSGDLSLHK